MDKLLTTDMQATLRALQRVGSVIEGDADGCHGHAKGELLLLRDARSREAKLHFPAREPIADQVHVARHVRSTDHLAAPTNYPR